MPLEHGQRADGGGQVHLAPPVQRIAEQLAKEFNVIGHAGQEFSVVIDGKSYWVTVQPDHWSYARNDPAKLFEHGKDKP